MSKATEPVERTHWHILWLVKEGQTPRQVAEQVGYSAGWIREVVRRGNEAGRKGIKDHRRELIGAKPLLSLDEQKELATDLEPNGSGRSPMSRWPIVPSRPWTNWSRSRRSAAATYKLILR